MFTKDDVLAKVGLQSRMTAGDFLFPALGVFGVGILVGAGVALMLAPKSGASLRHDIGRKAMDFKRKVMPGNGHNAREIGDLDDLEGMTRDELYARAAEQNIERRSGMTKPELIEAIRSS
jgi:gas vesicle protein